MVKLRYQVPTSLARSDDTRLRLGLGIYGFMGINVSQVVCSSEVSVQENPRRYGSMLLGTRLQL